MPSVVYTHLLRAAFELQAFTPKELADETGIALESIQTVLKRSPTKDLFEDIGADERVATARRLGRPERRYRLREPEAVRLQVTGAGLSDVVVGRATERSAVERASSILDLARANLHAALTEGRSDESIAARIKTARRTAAVILEQHDDIPAETRARAHGYLIASELLLSDGQRRIAAPPPHLPDSGPPHP